MLPRLVLLKSCFALLLTAVTTPLIGLLSLFCPVALHHSRTRAVARARELGLI